uniref:N(6)-L-threonylcarbamoyladenine synthase n=1 Tax=Oryza nivara TaxID=4536 RepID=A0A0E0FKI6_ORYNI
MAATLFPTLSPPVRGDGEILSQVVSSQEDLLVRWGGVAPKMAEEAHLLAIDRVVQKALDDANVSESDLSAVAVTVGPGLSLCLRVGVHKARKIAKSFHLPIVGVHHMEAQALVSSSRARLVSMRQHKDCNFSYAGLKTQVRLAIESRNISTDDIPISSATKDDRQIRANIAASFQIAEKNGLQLVCPPPRLCTDNGVMIAWTGIEHFIAGRFDDPPAVDEPDDLQYDLRPRWPLGEEYSDGRCVARSMKTARVHPSLASMIQGSVH